MGALIAILYAINYAITNRARGWGVKRELCALWLAIDTAVVVGNYHGDWMVAGAVTAVTWFFAIAFGWGEYFDYEKYPNNEIGWIDNLVASIHIRLKKGFVGFFGQWNVFLNRIANNIPFLDGISFALRGTYYLPLYLALGLVTHSFWFVLPALFFWQDGVVYYQAKIHTKPGGDYVKWAEIYGGLIRGLLLGSALVFSGQ